MSEEEALRRDLKAALQEITDLREAFAYEAAVRGDDLAHKDYPADRRRFGEISHERMKAAARGDWRLYGLLQGWVRQHARRRLGMPLELTGRDWRAQVVARLAPADVRAHPRVHVRADGIYVHHTHDLALASMLAGQFTEGGDGERVWLRAVPSRNGPRYMPGQPERNGSFRAVRFLTNGDPT